MGVWHLEGLELLTVLYGPGTTGFGEPIALSHRAAEADVHEALRVLIEGGAATQHEPDAAT